MIVSKLPVLPMMPIGKPFIQKFGEHNSSDSLDYSSYICTWCEREQSCVFRGRVVFNIKLKNKNISGSCSNFEQQPHFSKENVYNLDYGIFSRKVCPYIRIKQEESENLADVFIVIPGEIIVSPYLENPCIYEIFKERMQSK